MISSPPAPRTSSSRRASTTSRARITPSTTATSSPSGSTSDMAEVRLRAGREKSVRHRHPWVYSGAIERIGGDPRPGDIVDVTDSRGTLLGRGYCNPQSRITVRMLTWDDTPVDDALWHARVVASVRRRDAILAGGQTNACRLVHAEADFLPGLVVDRYADI